MAPIKPIFMKLVMAVQVFVQNYYTKFHENPTSCLVADTRSQMNIRTCFPIDTFFSRKQDLQGGKFVLGNTNKPQGRSAANIVTTHTLRSNEYRSFDHATLHTQDNGVWTPTTGSSLHHEAYFWTRSPIQLIPVTPVEA